MDFERWFKEGTSRFERVLIHTAALLLIMVIVSQTLLTQPAVRRMFSLVDRLEGEPYTPAMGMEDELYVELSIINSVEGDGVSVRVNGQAVAAFGNSKTVMVSVNEGDHVEIDGDVPAQVVEIKVSAVSEKLVSPQEGKVITFFGRPETVSWIIVERN
jgi:hypothetical protein